MLVDRLARLVEGIARRPRSVLAVLFLALALCVGSLSRMRIDTTLSGMLGGENPAAEALARITDDFHSAEDLQLLIEADGAIEPALAQKQLLEFATAFAAAAGEPGGAAAGITGVRYLADAEVEAYFRETVLPAGALWLNEAAFGEVLDRLRPEEVRAQMEQNAAMLAAPGPGAASLARQLVKDPLRLREFLLARFQFSAGVSQRAQFSDDGRALLISVSGAKPVNDIEFAKRFTAAVRGLAERVNLTSLGIRIGGGYAVASTTATMIRRDAILSTLSSIALIGVFLAAAYRRVLAPLAFMITAGSGVVAAFGVYSMFVSSITPLTAVLAAMLAGLGVDYAIHFRSHYGAAAAAGLSPPAASGRTTREVAGPLAAACVTSIFGFITITLSEVRMLKDFAMLGCIGLVGALLAVFVVLPALLALSPREVDSKADARRPIEPTGGGAERMLRVTTARPGWSIASGAAIIGCALVAIASTPGFAPPFESDPSALHPQPNDALETGHVLRERFRTQGESLFVLVRGDSAEELAARSHEVADRLATAAAREMGVAGTLGLASLVPDPRRVPERLAALGDIDARALVDGVREEIGRSEFEASAFDEYFEFLHRFLTNRKAPGVEEVLKHPEISRQLLPAASVDDPAVTPREAIVLVSATGAAWNRGTRAEFIDRVRTVLGDVPGATLTGMSVVAHDLEVAARRDVMLFGSVSLALVTAWLVAMFRRWADIGLAFAPVLFSIVCVFGVMSAMGERLNPVNIVAFPLLAGIAVDSGILLLSVARRAAREGVDLLSALGPTVHAIVCTTGTTALGFGTLVWTHTPAVRSLGLATLVGVSASLAACILILIPVMVWRAGRQRVSLHAQAGGGQ